MRRGFSFVGPAALLAATFGTACGGSSGTGFSVDGRGDDAGPPTVGGDDAGPATFGGDDASGTSGASLGDAGCATASAQAKRRPVYLEFVLDGSGSMASDNKWTAVVPALRSIFTRMSAAADDGVGAGLIVFSDSNDPTSGAGSYPSSADIPIGFVDGAHLSALSARLVGAPKNGTPTHAALDGGYGVLREFSAKSPLTSGGKKVLVLITDGVPSDDCSTFNLFGTANYSTNACVQLAASELKAASPKGPIETFVLGVGTFSSGTFFGIGGIDPSFLGNLAQAGGTATAKCNPNESSNVSHVCYFEIDPSNSTAASLQTKFEMALDAIRGQVVSCSFPLESSNLGSVDPTRVNVEVNGKTILRDPINGWTYDDPNTPTEIELHGSSCSSAEGPPPASVSIVLGCATQIAK